jgi:diacylglycerol kinase family enzyme
MGLPADRQQVVILANPVAGTRAQRFAVHELVHALHARGLAATPCWDRDELETVARSYGEDLRCVVAAGGDGTLNEVLNRAPGVPVAVLPLGNENLVARYFRLSRSASRLADIIVRAAPRPFDLARARGRYFSLMASAGIDAEVVHDVHRHRRGHINKFDYAIAALQGLWTYRFGAIEVGVEETGERLSGAMVFLFNLPVYGLGLPIATKARPDDGWLDLFVFERPGRLQLARYLTAILCHRHEKLPDVQYRRVRCVRLASREPIPLQTDGDPAGAMPVVIEVAPAALKLLVPC